MSCPAAPAISAGTSVVVGNTATYTCNTGYKMNGKAQIECISSTWEGSLPECLLINDEPTNNYFLDVVNNESEIPKWLIVLMGISASLVVILLICCLIVLLVKSCCTSKVYPEDHIDPGHTCCSYCFRIGDNSKRKILNDQNESSNKRIRMK